jgi:hypothetical protein
MTHVLLLTTVDFGYTDDKQGVFPVLYILTDSL